MSEQEVDVPFMCRSGEAGPAEPSEACMFTKVLTPIGSTVGDCYPGCWLKCLLSSYSAMRPSGLALPLANSAVGWTSSRPCVLFSALASFFSVRRAQLLLIRALLLPRLSGRACATDRSEPHLVGMSRPPDLTSWPWKQSSSVLPCHVYLAKMHVA